MPEGTTAAPLTLAVIGAGEAGRSVAAMAVAAGHRVLLEDVLPSRLRQAAAEIPEASGGLVLTSTVEDAVRDADLVIDFVPDELESKLEIVSMADRMAPPKTIFCIPTDALSIADLASCTYRADRCIALRRQGSAVTLVCGPKTSPKTTGLTAEFWRSVGAQVTVEQEIVR